MKSELLEKIVKDELLYGAAYIDPEKGRLPPKETKLTEKQIENNWVCVDGILKDSYIWIRKDNI